MQSIHYVNQDESILLSYEKQAMPFTVIKDHFHDAYEIYYMLSGERCYFIKDRTYHIKKGSLVFINKRELHRTLDTDAQNWERILINFKPEFVLSQDTQRIGRLTSLFNTGRRVLALNVKEQTVIEDILFKMLNETQHGESGSEEMLAAYLILLLVSANRFNKQYDISESASNHSIYNKAAPIVQYINAHYSEPINLQELANRFYISPFYLCKIFREFTGFTCIEYLNQVRVREAQYLLRKSDNNVMAVSEKAGFGSVSHFGRVFKEISGVSPYNYKKQHL